MFINKGQELKVPISSCPPSLHLQCAQNWSIAGPLVRRIMSTSDFGPGHSSTMMSEVSLSSDRDLPPILKLDPNQSTVDTEYQSTRSGTISGSPPASGSPAIPLDCLRCPGQWRWECSRGHDSTVSHSPSCSSPEGLLCGGECRFSYSDTVMRTAQGTWRRRRGRIVISILLVLGAVILSTMIATLYVLTQFISQVNLGQEVVPGELVTTVPTDMTGVDTTLSPDPVAWTLSIAHDAINMSLPLEHPEYLGFAMSANDTGED